MAVADNQEIKGSRKKWTGGKFLRGQRLFVALAAADAPATASDFTSDHGETGASTLAELRCVSVQKSPEVIPGVWFITCLYRAFVAYS